MVPMFPVLIPELPNMVCQGLKATQIWIYFPRVAPSLEPSEVFLMIWHCWRDPDRSPHSAFSINFPTWLVRTHSPKWWLFYKEKVEENLFDYLSWTSIPFKSMWEMHIQSTKCAVLYLLALQSTEKSRPGGTSQEQQFGMTTGGPVSNSFGQTFGPQA